MKTQLEQRIKQISDEMAALSSEINQEEISLKKKRDLMEKLNKELTILSKTQQDLEQIE